MDTNMCACALRDRGTVSAHFAGQKMSYVQAATLCALSEFLRSSWAPRRASRRVNPPSPYHSYKVFICEASCILLDAHFLLLRGTDGFAQGRGAGALFPSFLQEPLQVFHYWVFACFLASCICSAFFFFARVMTLVCRFSIGGSSSGGAAGGGSGGGAMLFWEIFSVDLVRGIITAAGVFHCDTGGREELDGPAAAGKDEALMLRVRLLIGSAGMWNCGGSDWAACGQKGFMSCACGMRNPRPPKYASSSSVGCLRGNTWTASDCSRLWIALLRRDWSSVNPSAAKACPQSRS